MFCDKCGAQLSCTADFCNKCGNQIKNRANSKPISSSSKWCSKYKASTKNITVGERKKGSPSIVVFLILLIGISMLFFVLKNRSSIYEIIGNDDSANVSVEKADKQSISDGNESLSKNESAFFTEDEMRECYQSRLETEEKIRILILKDLAAAKYVDINESDDTDYGKIVRESIIDNVAGDVILAEGVKKAANAVSEGKSFDEIMAETVKGIKSGAEIKAMSTLKEVTLGDAAEVMGIDVIDATKWVNDFFNVEDIPEGLLKGMVDLQYDDVNEMLGIVHQETFSPGDLDYLLMDYKAISNRQKEIILAGGETTEINNTLILESLVDTWNYEQVRIEKMVRISQGEFSEINSRDIRDMEYIRAITFIGTPINYDVTAYRESQKAAMQSSEIIAKAVDLFTPDDVIGNTISNVLGASAREDEALLQRQVQNNRMVLYENIESSLKESQYRVCVARSIFNGEYDTLTSDDNRMILAGYDGIENALEEYLSAIAKYNYDLELAEIILSNILSEKEQGYLDEINAEIASYDDILTWATSNACSYEDYTDDEKNERYCDRMDEYVSYLDFSLVNTLSETTFFLSSNITAYGVGNFNVYLKGQNYTPIIFAEQQTNRNRGEKRYLWIYDSDGNPIFIYSGYGNEYIRDDRVIRFDWHDGIYQNEEIIEKLHNNAHHIFEDYKNGVLNHSYERYAL